MLSAPAGAPSISCQTGPDDGGLAVSRSRCRSRCRLPRRGAVVPAPNRLVASRNPCRMEPRRFGSSGVRVRRRCLRQRCRGRTHRGMGGSSERVAGAVQVHDSAAGSCRAGVLVEGVEDEPVVEQCVDEPVELVGLERQVAVFRSALPCARGCKKALPLISRERSARSRRPYPHSRPSPVT
jgi:hypothetical protein